MGSRSYNLEPIRLESVNKTGSYHKLRGLLP